MPILVAYDEIQKGKEKKQEVVIDLVRYWNEQSHNMNIHKYDILKTICKNPQLFIHILCQYYLHTLL